ncbi:MAG TPA: TetR/AcrR family transcriptional regulator [Usitatibacter sp.]|jgi:TetR/AcrR family transcriptional repressor of nem operon|nr:TetR/AcrR family transcriptional regulator [Usitatibacter sp.]
MATATAGTSQRILDIAERLVQTRGYNGFSYADIAEALHVTKASLHYHFPAKADLGRRLIERYESNFLEALERIDATVRDPRDKLRRYAAIYGEVLKDNRMCLCGMLAAEFGTLPKPMREELRHYFDANEAWLQKVLEDGRKAKSLKFTGPAAEAAQTLLGALEGGMMIARSYADPARFKAMSEKVLKDLGA